MCEKPEQLYKLTRVKMIRVYAHYVSSSTRLYIFFILYYVICVEYVMFTDFSTNKIKIFIFRFQTVDIFLLHDIYFIITY